MQQAGVELAVHYGDMAFMGLAELITNANKIKKFIALCKADILAYKPDVIILIDYGGFNLQIARFGKKMVIRSSTTYRQNIGPGIPGGRNG